MDDPRNIFECLTYLNQIKQIAFAHGNIYLLFHSFKDNIIILDQNTKACIGTDTLSYSAELAVINDELFGIKDNVYTNKLISFNAKLE